MNGALNTSNMIEQESWLSCSQLSAASGQGRKDRKEGERSNGAEAREKGKFKKKGSFGEFPFRLWHVGPCEAHLVVDLGWTGPDWTGLGCETRGEKESADR